MGIPVTPKMLGKMTENSKYCDLQALLKEAKEVKKIAAKADKKRLRKLDHEVL